ncbi:hypothetical protein ElyMa_002751000 [Elysia marginata]|uniref:Uncharacterized protein n=1 Tax=Elysia marginata TaxID=1093978 RepID=A0AAV4HIA1_9GAST|nr:hypothetical protein ElyMa_002751000 [Elysia marginata]
MEEAVLYTVEVVRLVVLLAIPERIVVQNVRLGIMECNVTDAAASTVLGQRKPVTLWMVNVTRVAKKDTLEISVTKNVRLGITDSIVTAAAVSTVLARKMPVTMRMVDVTRAAIEDILEISVTKDYSVFPERPLACFRKTMDMSYSVVRYSTGAR